MAGGIATVGSGSAAIVQKEGYANVARWIALDPDNETFVFRRFDELAARDLLHLQSELLAIEKELEELDQADASSKDLYRLDVCRTWETLTESCGQGDGYARYRMKLNLKLREKLKEYHKALLRQSQIAQLTRPSPRILKVFSQWFKSPYPALGGRAKTILDKRDDLAVLKSTLEVDHLSTLMRRYWPAKTELSRDGLSRIGRFDENRVAVAVAIVNTLVAAILLVGSIASLYFVEKDTAKLGLVAMFTALFALSIGLVTNARHTEVFGATAAYAAVLVVFVSGDISNSSSGG